jgi:TPR repeat protein
MPPKRRALTTIGLLGLAGLAVVILVGRWAGARLQPHVAGACYAVAHGRPNQDAPLVTRLYGYACDLGHGKACLELGDLARPHLNEAAGVQTMERAYNRACDLGELRACDVLAGYYRGGSYLRSDPVRRAELVVRLCQAGDGAACGTLAREDVAAPAEAQRVLKDACRVDSGECISLSRFFGRHPEIDPDGRLAIDALDKPCQDRAFASEWPVCHDLGELLQQHPEQDPDGRRAAAVHEKACAAHPFGCEALGDHLMAHAALDPGHQRAAAAYAKACERAAEVESRNPNPKPCQALLKVLIERGDLRHSSSDGLRILRGLCHERHVLCGRSADALLAAEKATAVSQDVLELYRAGCNWGPDPLACLRIAGFYGEAPMSERQRADAVAYVDNVCRAEAEFCCSFLIERTTALIGRYASDCPDPSCSPAESLAAEGRTSRAYQPAAEILKREAAFCATRKNGCLPARKAIEKLSSTCASPSEAQYDACFALSVLHRDGIFVQQDAARAEQLAARVVQLQRRACEAVCEGEACADGACFHLGNAYLKGKGVPRDKAQAIWAYQKGCERGGHDTCAALVRLQLDGTLTPEEWGVARAILDRRCRGDAPPLCDALAHLEGREDTGEDAVAARRRDVEILRANSRKASRAGPRLSIQMIQWESLEKLGSTTLWETKPGVASTVRELTIDDVDEHSTVDYVVEGCPNCTLELEVRTLLEPSVSSESAPCFIPAFVQVRRGAPLRYTGNGMHGVRLKGWIATGWVESSESGAPLLAPQDFDRFVDAARAQCDDYVFSMGVGRYVGMLASSDGWQSWFGGTWFDERDTGAKGKEASDEAAGLVADHAAKLLRERVRSDPSILNSLWDPTRLEIRGRWTNGKGMTQSLPTVIYEYKNLLMI